MRACKNTSDIIAAEAEAAPRPATARRASGAGAKGRRRIDRFHQGCLKMAAGTGGSSSAVKGTSAEMAACQSHANPPQDDPGAAVVKLHSIGSVLGVGRRRGDRL